MKPLVAVVLAGGIGKRFWPLTTDKILFPFLGRTLFEFSVKDVLPKEVSKIVVIANELNKAALSGITFSVPHVTVVQPSAKGMADAILTAKSEIQGSSLLVLIADDITDPQLFQNIIKKALHAKAFGVFPGWRPQQYFPGGYLIVEGTTVKGIEEKPGEGNTPSPYVNISGHYVADADRLLGQLSKVKSEHDDLYEKSLTSLMQHEEFLVEAYEGSFASLKYPWHVLDIMEELLSRLGPHRGKNVEIKRNVIIEGSVYLDDNVRVFENTKITGPCYIGKGTIIGNNNIIRHSHIGAGCVTGFNTDITRSYIGDACWFHSNYIGDSVLEGNVSMGSGTVLANLRLDEGKIWSVVKGDKINTGRNKLGAVIGRNVRLGVNSSIMPGVKIGSNSFIGAGVVLDKDLPEESFCMGKSGGYTVVKNQRSVNQGNRDVFKKHL